MEKENISLTQLTCLIYIFLLGSSAIMGVGLEAKRDAWVAISIATVLGLGIVYYFYSINKMLPGKNLFEIMEFCFTRSIAIVLTFLYIIYFLYISSRVTRDFSELISTAILPITPIEIISLSFMLVIAYICYMGFEVLARVSEIFIPYIFGFLFLLIILLVASGKFDVMNILPILGDGFQPILKALFPSLITFPFGELVVFTVIFSSISNEKKGRKAALIGVFAAGSFITIGTLILLFSLSVEIIENLTFPLLTAVRQISIGNFIERIDALVVFIMMLGVLVKSSIFLYGGLKGIEYIVRIPYRYFAIPISLLISIFSNLIAHDFVEHKEEGLRFVTLFLHPVFQFILPTIILIFLVWKRKRQKAMKRGVEI